MDIQDRITHALTAALASAEAPGCPPRLAEAMRQEAMRYGPQAQQIFDFLRQNPSAQAQIRAPIFEEKVVDLIVSKAKVEDEKVSREELLKEDDMPSAYRS